MSLDDITVQMKDDSAFRGDMALPSLFMDMASGKASRRLNLPELAINHWTGANPSFFLARDTSRADIHSGSN